MAMAFCDDRGAVPARCPGPTRTSRLAGQVGAVEVDVGGSHAGPPLEARLPEGLDDFTRMPDAVGPRLRVLVSADRLTRCEDIERSTLEMAAREVAYQANVDWRDDVPREGALWELLFALHINEGQRLTAARAGDWARLVSNNGGGAAA